jgi:DNA-cytosine methyltransferase
MKELKVISLFSGYGTQELALNYCGINYKNIANCDILKTANEAYDSLHVTELGNLGDVMKVDEKTFPDCDLLTYSFPCFVGETLVLTRSGYKRIDEVVVGDEVLTHTNTYKRVNKHFDQGKKEIWSMTSPIFHELRTTENHRFYVKNKNSGVLSEPYWKEAQYLDKGDYLGVAINQESIIPEWNGIVMKWSDGRKDRIKNELSTLMDNLDFWWVIGRYIGDGWERTQGGIIICCSSVIDKELFDLTKRLEKIGFSYNISTEGSIHKLHIPKKEIGIFVSQFGKYAHGKKLNNTIFDLPKDLLKSFVDGYHSADGSLYKNSIRHRINSVSKELIYGVAQCVAKAYGIPYSIYKTENKDTYTIEGRTVNQRDYYTVVYDFIDNSKKKSYIEDGYIWSPIRKLTRTGEYEQVYDIEVDEDNSFTANGCIAHNCQDISLAGNQRGIKKGTRSGLLYEVERIVAHNKPKYLLMENVKNLVSKNHMSNFQDFIDTLTSIGYGSSWIVLNGADFGCPQNRERVFMMSVLNETHDVVREKLYSLVKIPRSGGTTVPMRPFLESTIDSSLYVSDTYQLTNTGKTSTCQLVAKRDNIKFDQRRRIYSIDAASPTLDIVGAGSLPQIMMDDKRFRSITPREGYRFMGVKDNDIDKLLTTSLSSRHHLALAGNSICVPVMEAIFNQFFQEYKKSTEFSTSELEIKN